VAGLKWPDASRVPAHLKITSEIHNDASRQRLRSDRSKTRSAIPRVRMDTRVVMGLLPSACRRLGQYYPEDRSRDMMQAPC
jgi:hypothetical protein